MYNTTQTMKCFLWNEEMCPEERHLFAAIRPHNLANVQESCHLV